MSTIEVKVPDIGDFKDVPVIEVLVKAGDVVALDDSLVTLESDKATMDVPAPVAGRIAAVKVKVGDRVGEGSLLLSIDDAGRPGRGTGCRRRKGRGTRCRHGQGRGAGGRAVADAAPPPAIETPAPRGEKGRADTPGEGGNPTPPAGATIEVHVPDIGDFKDVPIIEVFVKPGDIVKVDDPLVTIESDKATMDVPSPIAGVVEGVRVGVGTRVSEGTVILSLKTQATGAEPASRATPAAEPGDANRAVPPIAAAPSPSAGPGASSLAAPAPRLLPQRPRRPTRPASAARMHRPPCASSRASSASTSRR